ncbi:hypothetical protein [Bacillus sp. FSL R9-9410]|uniref:hypothetical protein n=1 Tax=Bacillus sp. FSL R9-9410 TaxID=2921590 RepID=UPI0031011CC8
MMNHIPSLKKDFIEDSVINRYVTGEKEWKSSRYIENISRVCNEKVRTTTEFEFFLKKLAKAFSVCRIEFENPYQSHKLFPEARGIGTHKLVIKHTYNKKMYTYYLMKYSSSFELIDEIEVDEKDENIALILYFDIYEINNIYGKFGFILTLLNGGHLIDNIQQFISHEGLIMEGGEIFPHDCTFSNDDFLFPGVKIMLSSVSQSRSSEYIFKTKYKVDFDARTIYKDDYYRSYVDFKNRCINSRNMIRSTFNNLYFQNMNMRTSGHNLQGLAFRRKICADFSFLKDIVSKYPYLKVKVFNQDFHKILFEVGDFLELDSVSYLVLIFIDSEYLFTQKDLAYAYLLSGQLMNEINSRISNKLFCRCIRNINEKYILSEGEVHGFPLYACMIGDKGLASNYKLERWECD